MISTIIILVVFGIMVVVILRQRKDAIDWETKANYWHQQYLDEKRRNKR